MDPALLDHLKRNWPLALVAVGLWLYIPFALIRGVFHTNQGRILKATDPSRYWKWILSFILLDTACMVVLAGSFLLSSR